MIELVAADERSGWGFAIEDGVYRAVRPPYDDESRKVVTEQIVGIGIAKHDFRPVSLEFENWDDLIAHVKRRVVHSRLEAGETIPTKEEAKEIAASLTRMAPPDIVDRYLDRIAEELIPKEEWAASEAFLRDLLLNPSVSGSTERLRRCRELLQRVELRSP